MFKRILIFATLTLFAVHFTYGSDYEKVQVQLDNLLADGSKLGETIDSALDAYVLGYNKSANSKISPKRLALMKEAFKGVARAYAEIRGSWRGQMSQEQILQHIANILRNRNLLISLMLSEGDREKLMIRLFLYTDIQNNPELIYDAVPIDGQLKLANSADEIKIDKITMMFDRGISGNQNRAIDAGEDIGLRIYVKNSGKTDFVNVSGFLATDDEFATIEADKTVYGKILGGQTTRPKKPYLLRIGRKCPDGHKIPFKLSIRSDNLGELGASFFITIYNVGPMTFSNLSLKSEVPGVKNSISDLDENIKFHLDITNAGSPPLFDINAALNCDASFVNIPQSTLKYERIDGNKSTISMVKAAFDVHIDKTAVNTNRIPFILFANGICHEVKYSWTEPFIVDLSQGIVEGQIEHQTASDEIIEVEEMVLIPAGAFLMGNNEKYYHERPVHPVYMDAFMIDKYEVTMGQYKKFAQATGRSLPDWVKRLAPTDLHPAVGLSWEDANAYAKWAGKRLPTEAEWEKAARGGLVGKTYPWGDEPPDERCNYGKKYNRLLPVGSFAPNGYGLYDMAGNAWEWCADWHSENYYKLSPKSNPKGPESGINRVLRGGSWSSDEDKLRCSARSEEIPTFRNHNFGFRCAKDVSQERKR